jgi:hypothetical protein
LSTIIFKSRARTTVRESAPPLSGLTFERCAVVERRQLDLVFALGRAANRGNNRTLVNVDGK